jgi:hypothetical protein
MKMKSVIVLAFIFLMLSGALIATEVQATQTTVNLSATQDAEVSERYPNANYGTSNSLIVNPSGGESANGYMSYIKFDLSSIPKGAVITSAVLRLFVPTIPLQSGYVDLYRVANAAPWDENTITWNNRVTDGTYIARIPIAGGTSNYHTIVDLTSEVQSLVDGTANNGWRLSSDPVYTVTGVAFYSKDSSENPPALEIMYEISPSLITVQIDKSTINPGNGETVTVSGRLTDNPETVGLTGKTVRLLFNNGVGWMDLSATTTDGNGYYSINWPQGGSAENGVYVFKAVFEGNGGYSGSEDYMTNVEALMVVPEYAFAGLFALLVCFAAFVVFKRR